MKFKLQAGAELDLITEHEMRGVLADWMAEITRGVKFRQFSARADVSGGVWTITQDRNNSDVLGPAGGMIWAVTRIAVAGNGFVAGTDTFSVYTDEITPSKLIESGLTRGARWTPPVVTLNGSEKLALSGVGTGAGTDVTVSGQAIELPLQLAWQLL